MFTLFWSERPMLVQTQAMARCPIIRNSPLSRTMESLAQRIRAKRPSHTRKGRRAPRHHIENWWPRSCEPRVK
jgi:hypothetical protein